MMMEIKQEKKIVPHSFILRFKMQDANKYWLTMEQIDIMVYDRLL